MVNAPNMRYHESIDINKQLLAHPGCAMCLTGDPTVKHTELCVAV